MVVAWEGGGSRDEEKPVEVRFMVEVTPTRLAGGSHQRREGNEGRFPGVWHLTPSIH